MSEHNKTRQSVCFDAYEELAVRRSPLKGAARMQAAMDAADAAWSEGMTEAEWRHATIQRLP
jgi:hypothetical protein